MPRYSWVEELFRVWPPQPADWKPVFYWWFPPVPPRSPDMAQMLDDIERADVRAVRYERRVHLPGVSWAHMYDTGRGTRNVVTLVMVEEPLR